MSEPLSGVEARPQRRLTKRLNGRQVTFLIFVVCLHTPPIVAIFTGAPSQLRLICSRTRWARTRRRILPAGFFGM